MIFGKPTITWQQPTFQVPVGIVLAPEGTSEVPYPTC